MEKIARQLIEFPTLRIAGAGLALIIGLNSPITAQADEAYAKNLLKETLKKTSKSGEIPA